MMVLYPYGLRKALTLSYDDGVETDIELIRILDEYGILATFNLNSGWFAPEGTVYPAGTIYRRMSESAIKALYAGGRHEVASHALTMRRCPRFPRRALPMRFLLTAIIWKSCLAKSSAALRTLTAHTATKPSTPCAPAALLMPALSSAPTTLRFPTNGCASTQLAITMTRSWTSCATASLRGNCHSG